MTVTLYGIPNCDTVKKARTWLDANGIPYVFHDFKKAGVTRDLLASWLRDVSWEVLLNRKGTTWRGLDDAVKASIADGHSAIPVMLETPSVIKRPVLVANGKAHVGFTADAYQQIFNK